jgi:chromodomain-helicase-DNA-binding protein 7
LGPYILRREKETVEKSVPPKEEIIIDVELTVPQKQYYRAIYEQNTAFLYKGTPFFDLYVHVCTCIYVCMYA